MATAQSSNQFRHGKSPETESNGGVSELGKNFLKDAADSLGKFGGSFMEQLFGTENQQSPEQQLAEQLEKQNEKPFRPLSRERVTLFSLREQQESREIQQIKQLLKQIKEEIQAIKKADAAMAEEIKAAEKLTLEVNPEAGTYHIHFLEVILKLLHTSRQKIGESSAWLNAMTSKKGKRGSAFSSRSKNLGTQYSMSEELKMGRPGQ